MKETYFPFQQLAQRKGALWHFLKRTFPWKVSGSGIVNTQYGPMLVVSAPILHSDNSGPANGRLLMGRFVDKTFDNKISRAIGERARILPVESKPEDENPLLPPPSQVGELLVDENGNRMIIHYPVKDVSLRSAFTIRVEAQKRIFEILEDATRLFFVLLTVGFMLLGAIFYFIINQLVVRRVKTISSTTNNIFTMDDLSQNIPVSYNDEITLLSRNINVMLRRLQKENIRKEEVERTLALNEKLIFLGKVSSGIAHEINNPLFAIANALQLIKKGLPPENSRANEMMTLVEKEVKRVRAITQNIHQLSIRKIEEPSLADLTSIMTAAVNVIKWSRQLKYTSIDFKQQHVPFPLYCNPETLQQVFMNLILNAIDAMDGKGEVKISITAEDTGYRVDFTDSGPGFAPEMRENMFTPFFTTKYGKGSGLGLYISNTIIMNHGGSITLDETYKDGAHLIVRIPKGGPSK